MINMPRNLRQKIASADVSSQLKPRWSKDVWAGVAIVVLLATSASAKSLIEIASGMPAAIRKFEPPSPIVRFHYLRSNCEEYHA
jgi:hypothetical protein